jgi:cell shape-determining protein MreD
MEGLNTILVLATALIVVFLETTLDAPRRLIGVQIDMLPPLMVFAALNTEIGTLTAVAVFGGLWFDSLSANPIGVSVLPLFLTGLAAYLAKDLVLRDQIFAQFILGMAASAAAPIMTLLLLLHGNRHPLVGWQSAWQWILLAVIGGALTPLLFKVLVRMQSAVAYKPLFPLSFGKDREMKRGRN